MKDSEIDLLAALQNKQKGGHFKHYTKYFLSDGVSFVLCGELHNDHRWSDGSLIHTSVVAHMHEEEKIVETRNTYYTLGTEVTHTVESDERNRLLSAL